MKNYKQTIREIYIDLRKDRGSKFLFVPKNLNFSDYAKLTFLDFINYEKADDLLTDLVLKDLQTRHILLKTDCVNHFTYKFSNHTVHDIYLTTTENKTYCRGTSIDYMEAFAKAVGEVLERTAGKYTPTECMTLANQEELEKDKRNFYPVLGFAQSTDKQKEKFPSFVYDRKDTFAWLKARRILGNEEILLPAQAIYYGHSFINKEKEIIGQSTHGLGAYFGEKGGIRSGLFEIVHRHFYLNSWYKNKKVESIDITSISKNSDLRKLILDFKERNFNARFLDFSDEAGIPTIICFLEIFGGIFCGGSSGLKMEVVLQRAILEAFATYMWIQQTTNSKQAKGNVLTQEFIDTFQDEFCDSKADAYNKVFMYSNSYFVNSLKNLNIFDKSLLVDYTEKFDKDETFDYAKHFAEIFKDIFVADIKNDLLENYDFFVNRVIVPNSYIFALSDWYSRPILKDGISPEITIINPFP